MKTSFVIVCSFALAATLDAQDFGDAPDTIPGCLADAVCDEPVAYPTLPGTLNAAPGRGAPFHLPPGFPPADFWLGAPADSETSPLLACCDWISAAAPGDCDNDDGALVLSLGPTPGLAAALIAGVFAGPDPNCTERISGCFGPNPVNPATGECWGVWYVEASEGPAAPGIPLYLNLVVDWDLSGAYGDIALEWAIADTVLAGPGSAGIYISAPFPVLTVGVDPSSPLGWSIGPFWTRAMVSAEELLPAFPGGSWDGSGLFGGYVGGETEDWVVLCDPNGSFTDCNLNGIPDSLDVWTGTSPDRNHDGIPDECQRPHIRRSLDPTATLGRLDTGRR